MKRQRKSHSWRRTISLAGLGVLLASEHVAAADADLWDKDDFNIPLWNYSTALRGGFGYKDNVLLGHTDAQGSALWMSSAEIMVFRLPTHGWQFNFFADASDTRFFDAPAVDNEQVALAVAQLSKEFGHGWKSAVSLNYMFQNQVFDNSANYTNRTSVGVIMGHTLTPILELRKTYGPLWMEGELNATRQWLDAPLDSFWQFGPRAVLGCGWGHGSELALAYQYSRLDYDNREQVGAAGAPIANTMLALNTHAAELLLTHVWDEKRRWQTITAAGFETSLDNGSGFFDYDCYRLSQRVRYRDEKWEVAAQVRLNHYEYSIQTVSATDTDLRRKTMFTVVLRAERKLTGHLMAHASYSWDRSISNLDFDDYQANTVVGGLALTF